MRQQNFKIARIRHAAEPSAETRCKIHLFKACECVCVGAKQFLGIKILITGSAHSSLGSKRRPSPWQWAEMFYHLMEGMEEEEEEGRAADQRDAVEVTRLRWPH